MKNDGYEADKNDIIVRHKGIDINLTGRLGRNREQLCLEQRR